MAGKKKKGIYLCFNIQFNQSLQPLETWHEIKRERNSRAQIPCEAPKVLKGKDHLPRKHGSAASLLLDNIHMNITDLGQNGPCLGGLEAYWYGIVQ